jgi:hypothetical protein
MPMVSPWCSPSPRPLRSNSGVYSVLAVVHGTSELALAANW